MIVRKGSLFQGRKNKEIYKVKKITKHYFFMVEMENIDKGSIWQKVTLDKNNLIYDDEYIKLKPKR